MERPTFLLNNVKAAGYVNPIVRDDLLNGYTYL